MIIHVCTITHERKSTYTLAQHLHFHNTKYTSTCTYIHVHMSKHTHTHTHTYIHTYIHTYTHIHTHTHTGTHTHTHIHTHTHTHTHCTHGKRVDMPVSDTSSVLWQGQDSLTHRCPMIPTGFHRFLTSRSRTSHVARMLAKHQQ